MLASFRQYTCWKKPCDAAYKMMLCSQHPPTHQPTASPLALGSQLILISNAFHQQLQSTCEWQRLLGHQKHNPGWTAECSSTKANTATAHSNEQFGSDSQAVPSEFQSPSELLHVYSM
jgi:hypothetical protein